VSDADRPTFLALAELYEAYEAEKVERGPVDFADLILLPIELLTAPEHTTAADTVRKQYPHVLVDEFQDVSEATGRLLYALCTEAHPPWVVGDARQAIFRFLGAHPENVSGFLSDYPTAKRIELDLNYRSCPEVVIVNNALAALMESSELEQGSARQRWRSAPTNPSAHGEDPVVVTVADSDTGERAGVADHVKRMIDEENVGPDDIAVLARRNVDVRAIAVALGERGVEVSTVGLVTPEGAAGDLLAAASVRDAPDAAVVRLAAALGRERYGVTATNTAVRHLLQDRSACDGYDLVGAEASALADEVKVVLERLQATRGRPDAFGLITAFLFEASDYLRRILDLPTGAARAMALTEIASTLSEAGLYRFTHGDADAATARRGFISYFEGKLRDGTPSRIAPGAAPGSVRVMTTHASKGLQFPHVVVAGQTMPPKQYWSSKQYKWIPKAARPTEDEDLGQADSLLFVGASRAQRSLIVSYAETATPSERARRRPLPPLLESWISALAPSTRRWPSMEAGAEVVEMGRVWGGTPQERMGASSFEKRACIIKAYLGEELGLDLPETDRPLYPVFFGSVRTIVGALVEGAHTEGRALTTEEARSVAAEHWPPESAIGHRHLPMFTELLNDAAEGFAEEYEPLAVGHRPVDLSGVGDALGEPAPSLRFSAAFREDGGRLVLILFRPESLATELAKREPGKGNLKWSGGSLDAERTRVAIVRSVHPNALILVYSAADRTLYEWNPPSPPKGKNLPAGERILGEVERTREMFASGRLEHAVSEFQCGRCRRRTVCPHWNELAET
jgi:superfamily I DNA/RNA helicase